MARIRFRSSLLVITLAGALALGSVPASARTDGVVQAQAQLETARAKLNVLNDQVERGQAQLEAANRQLEKDQAV